MTSILTSLRLGVSRKGPGRMSAFALSDPPRPCDATTFRVTPSQVILEYMRHADSYPSTSSSLTHRASPFWKEKLKAVQQQLSDASGEEDPTCNSIAWNECLAGGRRDHCIRTNTVGSPNNSCPLLDVVFGQSLQVASVESHWNVCNLLLWFSLHPSQIITVSEKVAVKYVVYCTAGCNQDFAGRLCSMYTCKHESWGAECRRAQCMGLLNFDEFWKYMCNAFRMIVGGKLWMWTFCINGQNQHAAYIDLETASRISELIQWFQPVHPFHMFHVCRNKFEHCFTTSKTRPNQLDQRTEDS